VEQLADPFVQGDAPNLRPEGVAQEELFVPTTRKPLTYKPYDSPALIILTPPPPSSSSAESSSAKLSPPSVATSSAVAPLPLSAPVALPNLLTLRREQDVRRPVIKGTVEVVDPYDYKDDEEEDDEDEDDDDLSKKFSAAVASLRNGDQHFHE